MNVCIIGRGRVGTWLEHAFQKYAVYTHIVLLSHKEIDRLQSLPPSDVYFITVPDTFIADIIQRIAKFESKSAVFFHGSGALLSDLFITSGFIHAGSFHPIRSITGPEESVEGTFIAYEGTAAALAEVHRICMLMQCHPIHLQRVDKSRYHLGTVMASNFIGALLSLSMNLLEKEGISKQDAFAVVTSLAQSSLLNITDKGLASGLTGPAVRGDAAIIEKHREVLKDDPKLLSLYDTLTETLKRIAFKE